MYHYLFSLQLLLLLYENSICMRAYKSGSNIHAIMLPSIDILNKAPVTLADVRSSDALIFESLLLTVDLLLMSRIRRISLTRVAICSISMPHTHAQPVCKYLGNKVTK